MSHYLEFLFTLIPTVPMLIVTVGGIVVATARRAQHPRAFRLLALGLGALTLNLIGSALRVYVSVFAATDSAPALAQQLLAFNGLLYVLNLAGLTLVTVAAFAGRAPAAKGV